MKKPEEMSPETWAVVSGRPSAPGSPLNHPITAASNFRPGGDHWYVRNEGTDALDGLEATLGGLERGSTVVFSSGMAAASAVLELVPMGGAVAVPTDCYHGVAALARSGVEQGRWGVTRVEPSDTDGWVAAARNCDLLWLETPSNPLLELTEVAAISSSADRRAIVAVDATLATPLGSRHLARGADVVMHSATKFIGGHSDLLLGTVSSRDETIDQGLRTHRRLAGAFPGALEVFLCHRGVRTLALRYERASANAAFLADELGSHPKVKRVYYPGSGAMVSFQIAGGDQVADRLCGSLELIANATSLGGVETTLERRSGYGEGSDHLPPGLIRMSVGVEAAADLWRDLEEALKGLDTK